MRNISYFKADVGKEQRLNCVIELHFVNIKSALSFFAQY